MTADDDCKFAYSRATGTRSDYNRGLGLSVVLHAVVVAALSLVAVSPRSFFPTIITTASLEDAPGDLANLEIASPEIEIQPAKQPKATTVNVDTLTNIYSPSRRHAKAVIPQRKYKPQVAHTKVEQNLIDMSAPVVDPTFKTESEQQTLTRIQKRVKSAGGSTGRVQFSLAWAGRNDLDLHVIAPSGERVFFHNKKSECYAELDVDMNARPVCESPIENIHWPKSRAPEGRYTILVHFYRQHVPSGSVPYQLVIKRADHTEVVHGIAQHDNQFNVHRTLYIAPHIQGYERAQRVKMYRGKQKREEATAARYMSSVMGKGATAKSLATVVVKYPHTNAAFNAIQLLARRRTQLSQSESPLESTLVPEVSTLTSFNVSREHLE